MKGEHLFSFIGGALVGAAIAVLFAPEAGEETRKKIKGTVEREYKDLKAKFNELEHKVKTEIHNYTEPAEPVED